MKMSVSLPRLRVVHATVTERCMRRSPGKTVGVDMLLASQRAHRLYLTALYWTTDTGSATDTTAAFPELNEMHFFVEGDCVSEDTRGLVDWHEYDANILPDGTLVALKTT